MCLATPNSCGEARAIRLSGRVTNTTGPVEICYNGTVCGDLRNDTEAGVACKQLATGAIISGFNITKGRIQQECTGSEIRLTDHEAGRTDANSCNHSVDACVLCGKCTHTV